MDTTILDDDRLDAAVLALCAGSPLLRQALDRGLFLADMATFAETGAALTGSTYVRAAKGPGSLDLDAALRLLVAQGRLKRTEERRYGLVLVCFLSIEPYDLRALSEAEIELLATVGRHVRGGHEPTMARLLVDETVGSFAQGEEIPYDSAWELLPFEPTILDRPGMREPAFA